MPVRNICPAAVFPTPGSPIEERIDRCYDDETMERLFPHLRFIAG